MLTRTQDKKTYFNRYWQTRDLPSADARSRQRARLVMTMLTPPDGDTFLDVGCGRGLIMRVLQQYGYTTSGCDLSTDAISELAADGFDVFVCDLEQDGIPGRYGAALCLEVLQQVFDPVGVINKIADAVSDRGYLIISVPNEFHLLSRLKLLFGRSHLGHFDDSHIRLFSPKRARQMFAAAGLHIDRMIPVSVIPPRMKGLNVIGALLAKLCPGLFSLSQIYRLRKP